MFNLEAVSCQKKILKMSYLRMDGMDGMGWDGMGRGIKSVLQFSLYFVGI